ncbi:hypothetical protein [Streptosporangium subroseum]|nr:hypothetical protein [Streptosporangium subroseum]
MAVVADQGAGLVDLAEGGPGQDMADRVDGGNEQAGQDAADLGE